jgi:hypothetical protein
MKRMLKTGVSVLLIAVIVCALGLGVSAWGPASRETFTTDNLPNHVAFNSITNNPGWNDERGFMQIKESDQPDSEYTYGVTLQPGRTYTIRAYYHNNAPASSNGLNFEGPGVARGAYARVVFPGRVDGVEYATFLLGAENAQHFDDSGNDLGNEVFGNITLRSERSLDIQYVEGSARLHNSSERVRGSETRFFSLPNSLFTDGALIGFDTMDGVLPGGQFYDGVITFNVHVLGDSDVAAALDAVVTTAIFAALLAFFAVCLFGRTSEKFWDMALVGLDLEDRMDTSNKKTTGKSTKTDKAKMKAIKKTAIFGVVLILIMAIAIIASTFLAKGIHRCFFSSSKSESSEVQRLD